MKWVFTTSLWSLHSQHAPIPPLTSPSFHRFEQRRVSQWYQICIFLELLHSIPLHRASESCFPFIKFSLERQIYLPISTSSYNNNIIVTVATYSQLFLHCIILYWYSRAPPRGSINTTLIYRYKTTIISVSSHDLHDNINYYTKFFLHDNISHQFFTKMIK